MLVQERLAVDGRPDGRVVAQQMRCVGDGERLLGGMDTVFVAAVQLALLLGIGHPDAPVGRLHDVKWRALFSVLRGEGKHVGIHAQLNPVVGLDNGNPGAGRLGQAAVAGGAVALVLFIDNLNALVLRGVALHGGKRIVGAAIVEQDDFQVLVSLPDDAIQTLLQVRAGIVNRYDNRNKRFAHVCPSVQ